MTLPDRPDASLIATVSLLFRARREEWRPCNIGGHGAAAGKSVYHAVAAAVPRLHWQAGLSMQRWTLSAAALHAAERCPLFPTHGSTPTMCQLTCSRISLWIWAAAASQPTTDWLTRQSTQLMFALSNHNAYNILPWHVPELSVRPGRSRRSYRSAAGFFAAILAHSHAAWRFVALPPHIWSWHSVPHKRSCAALLPATTAARAVAAQPIVTTACCMLRTVIHCNCGRQAIGPVTPGFQPSALSSSSCECYGLQLFVGNGCDAKAQPHGMLSRGFCRV